MGMFSHKPPAPSKPLHPKPGTPSRRKGWPLVMLCAAISLFGYTVLAMAGEAPAGIGCSQGDEAYYALKLTKFNGGIRVDYVVVASGERTWANMNSELVRQFRVKEGTQFCMVQTKRPAEWVDYD